MVVRERTVRCWVGCLTAVLLLSACGASADTAADDQPFGTISVAPDGDGWVGIGLDEPYVLPNVRFTDTSGEQRSWPRDAQIWPVTVVLFGYTNCPDECQTQLADFAAARRGMSAAEQEQMGLVLITTDPERDDAATLRTYLDRYDRSFVGWRAESEDALAQAAAATAVALDGIEPNPEGGYTVGHGAQLLGVGVDGTVPVMWLPGGSVADLRADLRALLAQNTAQ